MRRLSFARSFQVALLSLTLALAVIAALGIAALYDARQRYENRLAATYELQTAGARLLAAGVVAEAARRTPNTPTPADHRPPPRGPDDLGRGWARAARRARAGHVADRRAPPTAGPAGPRDPAGRRGRPRARPRPRRSAPAAGGGG